ncbi:DUF5686 and carboxypeptidase regulatory-like domain-containing protein [Mucilaginibacter roseus]|uniref:DUF5686 and carboxypeptidase regulatory-like domain-containing protein n=1 Tax=Mucilaginibacter roseus TaxID=1528868 RepID=A0ABS8U0Z6_9SPHI|nr:DUF5686 and carboxypeptidase-like regulatory domain-containing protein [Mucilaginibacter roseus]MCD8739532.1 DUF5686 and carboxypeptidase regulatory-like domain-containing protein [Mucilaginibacter roseus]
MNINTPVKKLFLLTLLLLQSTLLLAQITVVNGTVIDAKNKKPLPYVSVAFAGTSTGTTTNADGRFFLQSVKAQSTLQVSFVGYKTVNFAIKPGAEQNVTIRLTSEAQALNEVIVKSQKKQKYSNKNNPAVELIRKVIENKEKNQPESYEYVEYRSYDKMQFSFLNVSSKLADKKFFKKYKFLIDNRDTTTIPGKNLLPFYLNEKVSHTFYRKNPEKKHTVVLGEKAVNFGPFVDSEGIGAYFKHMYSEINIYDNNVMLLTNQWLSPIAGVSPNFYKFFITDTVTTASNEKLVELSFTPRNTADMLFEGMLYVTLDGNYAVQRAVLKANRNINLNFVKSMEVDLDFAKNTDGRYHLSKSTTLADFGFNKDKSGGLFGIRTITFDKFFINTPRPDAAYAGEAVVYMDEAKERNEQFWQENRLDTLSTAESKVYTNIDSLTRMPSYRRAADLLSLLVFGYKGFGKFEVGPANSFYSFNPVEGFRLRFGGRTTYDFSKRIFFETYAAYGFKDERWKYFLSSTYSLNAKSIYKFPQHYVRASFQRDTKIPGLNLDFVREDNFLLSFKRGNNDKYLYNDFYRFDYVREFENHFSYKFNFTKWTQEPAGSLYFNRLVNSSLISDRYLTTSELNLNLRYAPYEQFYQGKMFRTPILSKYPIFNLYYTKGIKDLFGGQYGYDKLLGRIDKHFYLSVFGYADVSLEAGHIFGKVPYPLLNIHRANQTYAYDVDSYNLMNFLEFVSDDYQAISIDQHFYGFFFNKIPLLKKLKWREVVSFKALYGGLRSENDPSLHPDLYQFPVDEAGKPITYSLGSKPYIEGSVGIENIFKFIRLDLVKRFNYLDNPNVSEWGLRTRITFDF